MNYPRTINRGNYLICMISVKYRFNNNMIDIVNISEELTEYLSASHIIKIEDTACMRDFLLVVLNEIEPDRSNLFDDEYLYRRFNGFINGEARDINVDFPVKDYFNANNVDGCIYLYYHVAMRGGWGYSISAEISLHMPSSEKGHERVPHVHVQKGKYIKNNPHKNTIRVSLIDLTVMDGAENKAKKLFSKQWDFVLGVIKNNQKILTKQYNDMLCGAQIESIVLNLENETASRLPNFLKY